MTESWVVAPLGLEGQGANPAAALIWEPITSVPRVILPQ